MRTMQEIVKEIEQGMQQRFRERLEKERQIIERENSNMIQKLELHIQNQKEEHKEQLDKAGNLIFELFYVIVVMFVLIVFETQFFTTILNEMIRKLKIKVVSIKFIHYSHLIYSIKLVIEYKYNKTKYLN